MKIQHILAIALIFLATTVGWFILGGALAVRTEDRGASLSGAVDEGWGPPLAQAHPETWYLTPGAVRSQADQPPSASQVKVALAYEPKKKGLLWHRTYQVRFEAEYTVLNPSPVTQTLYVRFRLPAANVTYQDFSFRLGEGAVSSRSPREGIITEAIQLPPGASAPLQVSYTARGTREWRYRFGENSRVRNFSLTMNTDFAEIDFPASSPTRRERASDGGWSLSWEYPDVLSAGEIALAMPSVVNAGPVAARIAFFAPVGLLFFFTVVMIFAAVLGRSLHPMNYFFLAAGFFAFQLLFAYLVDLVPLVPSFLLAAGVSLLLVGTYTHAVSRGHLTLLVVAAQAAFMVLFSYSFFFEGLTGLTITIGAIVTLAILMRATARIDWATHFSAKKSAPQPPPIS